MYLLVPKLTRQKLWGFMRYSFPSGLLALFIFPMLGAASASADGFRHVMEQGDNKVLIEQAYSDDGAPRPVVSINGAVIRDFAFAQRLSLVLDAQMNEEAIALVHHWQGGNGCSGELVLFSLSPEGFYRSPAFGGCTETYDSTIIQQDGLSMVEITTYTSGDRAEAIGTWRYHDGSLIKK